MKLMFIFFILFFVIIQNAKSQPDSIKIKNSNAIVFLSAGLNLGLISGSFFDVYKSELGGKNDAFSISPNIAAGLKFLLTDQYRFGATIEFAKCNFLDSYEQKFKSPEGVATRTITQEMSQSVVPMLLTAEIVPYPDKQFKSYYGVGIGVTINDLNWDESVYSNFDGDKRKGGNQYRGTYYSPTIRFFAAVELGFDRNPYKFFLGGLILEMRYTHFFTNVDIFEKIRTQFIEIPVGLNESQSLLNGYFSLNLAVSFNLTMERQRNKN